MDARHLTDAIALTLLGVGTHVSGLGGLAGLGEITLRDSLVAACAAEGSRRKQPWIFAREQTPPGWTDESVDVVVQRKKGTSLTWVTALELKWWRDATKNNASNRRTALARDILRCGSVHDSPGTDEGPFLVLVSTRSSWEATMQTNGGDREVCHLLESASPEIWPIKKKLRACPAVARALGSLVKLGKGSPVVTSRSLRLPPPSSLRTTFLGRYESDVGRNEKLQVRVWKVAKVQNSRLLTLADIEGLSG